ncbi:MAG: hypothetical protein Q8O51_02700 [bacterium]|nr:hypothetical protein [bacterium]
MLENGWKIEVFFKDYSAPASFEIPDEYVIEVREQNEFREIKFRDDAGKIRHFSTLTGERLLKMERAIVAFYSDKQLEICAITTAVTLLNCSDNTTLDTLRCYRRQWLESFTLGQCLSRWYDRWSPPVAQWLATSKWQAHFLLKVFIQPCAWMAAQAEMYRLFALPLRIVVACWYVAASLTAKLLYSLRKVELCGYYF